MRIASISFKLFFLALLAVAKTRADSEACEQKEKHLALLDLSKDSISKAKDLQPDCGNDSEDIPTNSSECGAKAKVSANLDLATNLIDAAKENYTTCDSEDCEQKEKHLALLDLAKDSITKAKDLHPSCDNDSEDLSTNSSECGAKAKVSANLDLAMNLINAAKENYKTCDVGKDHTKVVILHENPADCSEILENGDKKSGRYTIWPRHQSFKGRPLDVYCDMDTDGGGWTVIQRRGNFTKIDFYRNWNDYKNGFGNISEEFWIGNDKIFALTNQANHTLRFDLENVGKEHRFAEYSSFSIEDESAGYMLHYESYKGTAGDSMSMSQSTQFSTKDKQYEKAGKSCPSDRRSGWWFDSCSDCNPNGLNLPGVNNGKSMFWGSWTKTESLLAIEMKIRPVK